MFGKMSMEKCMEMVFEVMVDWHCDSEGRYTNGKVTQDQVQKAVESIFKCRCGQKFRLASAMNPVGPDLIVSCPYCGHWYGACQIHRV